MEEQKRVLNNMPGFKKGFEAVSRRNNLGSNADVTDDQIAFVLGALAGVYNSIENDEKLWETRQRIWKIEEALGQGRQAKIKPQGPISDAL